MRTSSIDPDPPRILHTDAHLLGVFKPAGVPSQPDPSGDPCITALVGVGLPDPPHRLDRPVSGVMVLARTREAMSALGELFRNGAVEKTYDAVVQGKWESGTVLGHWLRQDGRSRRTHVVGENGGGQWAELQVRPVLQGDRYTWLEVRPSTGRFHQIRAQLAAAGHPIYADVKYGARRTGREPGIALHARSIRFMHPFTGEELSLVCDPPDRGIWAALRRSVQ